MFVRRFLYHRTMQRFTLLFCLIKSCSASFVHLKMAFCLNFGFKNIMQHVYQIEDAKKTSVPTV